METVERLYRAFEEIGSGDRAHFARRVTHWETQLRTATMNLRMAKRNGEEVRFWSDARRKAEKKLAICANMAAGGQELDFQLI